MAQGVPRTRFNSSRLVRALAELAVADVGGPKLSFAERLGEWLDFNDALALFSALNAGAGEGAGGRSATLPSEAAAVARNFARVRGALVDSIRAAGGAKAGPTRNQLPTPAPNASVESAADYTPYQQYYLARQREMAASIGPLRANVRAALSRQSATLKRLAVLDAVLDQALAVRERNLLATVPGLLGKRFERLYEAHRVRLGETGAEDDPQRWMQPGEWLAVFCADMQAALLAELELRLQPAAGLIAALHNEVTN